MSTITVDEQVLSRLRQAGTLAEVRDGHGTLIGFYAPVDLPHAAQYVQAAVRISPAELGKRREGGGKKYTTAEVLAHLDSLGRVVMRFTVRWPQSALDALALTWMQAADKEAVRGAADRVDHELEWNADTKGVDFYGDRLLIIGGLHVAYSVDVQNREVTVLDFWYV